MFKADTMSTSRQMVFQMIAESRQADFERSFRRRSLLLLLVPGVLAVVAFVMATTMGSQQSGMTGFWQISGTASLVYLIFAFLYSPAYMVGVVWFWLCTNTRGVNVRRRLLAMPLITACFVWCPVMLVPTLSLGDRVLAFLALIPTALVVGWVWSFIVRWSVAWSLRKHPAFS